jgi:Tol biopolymer transport system component/DNA-binding winged helix-turn-helix (wHTH) protein
MNWCSQAPKSIRFGLFEADLDACELRKRGRRVKLQEQPFQVLALLVQHAGQIVSREELRQALWSADTFVEFEQGVNTAIKKIRQALGDCAENPRFIETLPRKGYRFIAPVAASNLIVPSPDSARTSSLRLTRFYWIFGISLVVSIAAGAGWFLNLRSARQDIAFTSVPLTSYAGLESSASFSPDGNEVAFVWNGEKQDNFDIYVKLIGSESPLRITKDPARDFSPAWSPEGRSIAFLRAIGENKAAVFLIPPIGGAERRVAEIACCAVPGSNLAWSPDGKWLAAADNTGLKETLGLILLSPDTDEKRKLTSPPQGWLGDGNPAFSPDGRSLAFARWKGFGQGEIFVLPLSHDTNPKQAPVQITFSHNAIGSPTWTGNGREILFSSGPSDGSHWLWRLPIPVKRGPERLASLGDAAYQPVISRQQRRLAYTQMTFRTNTWRLDLPSDRGKPARPVRLLSSTHPDYNPQYSPDGKHIAFHSMRSGWSEIWVCDTDGTNARQLTHMQAPMTGSPRWSPDGNRIVFDSNAEGQYELYTMNADGGKLRRLTINPADDAVGSWSRDGKWIYFASHRSGEWQVWKMPADGGRAVPVTRNGGYVAFESADARFVYYSKARGDTSLWRVPVDGGEEQRVLESVRWLSFVVVSDGIYFMSGHGAGAYSIRFFDFRTGATTTLASIKGPVDEGLSVSPDRRQILYSEVDQVSRDLMLVENFR